MNTPLLFAVANLLLATGVFADEVTFTKITTGPVATGVSGAAAAWGDYNNDGWVDLYVTTLNGVSYLYSNNGNGTFTSITGVPISAGGVNSFGCAWADYDNDGFLDLLQGGYNLPSRLFHNNGNGTFSQITTGVAANIDRGANNVLWGDYDNDGFVDIFIAISFNSPKNVLYHNDGSGAFTKVIDSPPVNTPGNTQGASWSDYDNDGRLDLVVDHTGSASQLFHNEGNGRFLEITNSAISELGSEVYGGASWGDYDNDGFLDLFVSSYGHHSALYHNNGNGTFTRVTNSVISQPLAKSTGGAWADYDNDGFLDLFVANDSGATSFLYHNNSDGTFTAVTTGLIVNDPGTAQGAAWGDYNNDGFPDLFVPNIRTYSNSFYRNDGNTNAWLTLKLEGRQSNRAAIGAKVRMKATIHGREVWQMREISGGGSLGSQNDLRAMFGLGDATNADLIRIEWPSGIVQELSAVSAKQFLTVIELDAHISPANQEVPAGSTAVFAVATTLPGPLNLQWKFNNIALPDETNATLTITNTQIGNLGSYTVSLLNPETGFAFKTPAATLAGAVTILQQPLSQTNLAGSNVTFRVVASGVAPLGYQWKLNGTNLPTSTADTLTITNVQPLHEGAYTVAVSNGYGTLVSSNALLGVLIKPVITLQPLSQSIVAGGDVTFSVSVTGYPPPFGFRWRKAGLGILATISQNETTSYFTVTNVQPAGTNIVFTYSVIVTNAAPGLVLSSNALLTVLADSDGDGLPDSWETAHGLSPTDPADAGLDSDGDGMTNLQEYLAGTDPNDPQSLLRLEGIEWITNATALLRFTAMSNKTYTLQSCPLINGAAWSRVADVPAARTNRTIVVSDPISATAPRQRFYRLTTPRVP